MPEENINQEFRLKKNRLNKKLFNWGKVCRVLKYTDHSLIAISTITGCVYFCYCFFGWYYCRNTYRNTKLCNWVKICVITVDIENYKPMIKKKKEEAQ